MFVSFFFLLFTLCFASSGRNSVQRKQNNECIKFVLRFFVSKKEPKCVDRRGGKLKECSFVANRRSARQMPIVGLLKKFIRGEEKKSVAKSVPSIVRLETDVAEYWTLKEVIGDGAFGNVYKAVSKSDPTRVAAAKVCSTLASPSENIFISTFFPSKWIRTDHMEYC